MQLNQSHPDFLHINCLEFVIVILQLVRVIVRRETMSPTLGTTILLDGIPTHPVVLIWTDNTAAKAWANRVSSSSIAGQNLLGVYAALLKQYQIGVQCDHVPGEANIIADFISRPNNTSFPFRNVLNRFFSNILFSGLTQSSNRFQRGYGSSSKFNKASTISLSTWKHTLEQTGLAMKGPGGTLEEFIPRIRSSICATLAVETLELPTGSIKFKARPMHPHKGF